MVDWETLQKIKNFSISMSFDQKAWTKAHEKDRNLGFLKKKFFEKFLKLDWLPKIHRL